jgi:phosphopentomutase
MKPFRRVIWLIVDGVGAGALPDAAKYGDEGSDTLGNLDRSFHLKTGRPLQLPNFQRMGLGNLTPMPSVPPLKPKEGHGAFGRASELSGGKDTTSGHWEMAGLPVRKAFPTYPNGFPREILEEWTQVCQLSGVLGNRAASGTEIIEELGMEHLETGKPIVYTSADSVWQIAAHENAFGLERLYEVSKAARKICDRLQIGRVIARPFIGDPRLGKKFERTYHRKDYSLLPERPTLLTHLVEQGVSTIGVGKISNIFAGQGIQENLDTHGNTHGLQVLLEQISERKEGLLFCNLIDTDMNFGHRRDVVGYGHALEEIDLALPKILEKLGPEDLFLIASDHGNDPTFKGSDHTREFIPILGTSPRRRSGAVSLGDREGFGDVGATVYEALTGQKTLPAGLEGTSFLSAFLETA